jgi:hypothetical protein
MSGAKKSRPKAAFAIAEVFIRHHRRRQQQQ